MNLVSIARHLPYPLQQPLRYIYGALPTRIRYGQVFWESYNFLKESQWWSKEKLEEYQMQQLSQLLNHAYENVPYYQRVFDERGLKPKDIQGFDDLRKLPYLTKEIIQENLPELVARNYPESKLQYVTTGGSTGIPLGLYCERGVTTDKEQAFLITMWGRVGFRIGDRCAILRGDIVPSASKGKFWEYNPASKSLVLSSYHMTDETLPNYIEKIREFKPAFIQAYPSTITILVRFMNEKNIPPFSSVKAILCASENLYPWQRELVKSRLKCRVWDFYGHAERAALAGQCEKTNFYHVQSEYGIVELIDEKGNPATNENEMAEIVATGFNNFACPLIRYRTLDLAIHTNGECECGRSYSLLKRVEGRLQEFIVASDGSLIALGPAIFGIHDAEWTKVKQIQFLQETQGELIIQVVKNTSFSDSEIASYVLRLFKARLEGRCKLIIRFVDHIPRTQSGKYRFLIQKLPIEFEGHK
jgi:phenylacetate-CoA ligase